MMLTERGLASRENPNNDNFEGWKKKERKKQEIQEDWGVMLQSLLNATQNMWKIQLNRTTAESSKWSSQAEASASQSNAKLERKMKHSSGQVKNH